MLLTIVMIVFIIMIVFWTIRTYNMFITLGERVTNGKAQIATQIESRWDAIKNLIHNDVVTKNSRHVRMFPSNMIANMFNFTKKEYFRGTESKRDMPEWD